MPARWRSAQQPPLGLEVPLRPGSARSSRSISARSSSSLPEKRIGSGRSARAVPPFDRLRRKIIAAGTYQGVRSARSVSAAATGRAGAPTTVAPAGTSSTTTALAPIFAPAPIRTRRSPSRRCRCSTPRLDRRAADVAGSQADRHEGPDHGAGMDLDQAVDDDLAVQEVDARDGRRPGRRSRPARSASPACGRAAAAAARPAPAAAPSAR